jgi:hypothetical protein
MAMQPSAKQHNVTLQVDDSQAHGDWEATSDASGKVYRYRYSGGNKGGGHVGEKIGDPQTVHIKLAPVGGATNYAISRVDCPVDPHRQLTPTIVSSTQCDIDNKNQKVQQAYYCVFVKQGNSEFACDPMISNLPT